MRKIFLFILTLSIFIWYSNFSYFNVSANSEIEKIYNDLISKVESRMNTAISDLEKMYENNISRTENTLNVALDTYERTEQTIARQSFAASSYDLSLANQITNEWKIKLTTLYNNILTIRTSLDNLKAKKDIDLNNLKSKYQKQIDDYKLEMNNLINQNNNSSNNGNYFNNNENQNNINTNQQTCWLNSSPSSNWNCSCNSWYTWEYPNDSSNFDCIKAKTPDQLCQDSYWINSIATGSQNSNGSYNCNCKTWYTWNSNTTACIKEFKKEEPKKEEPKKEEVKINLPDNIKKQIDKAFDNIKSKLSKLPIWKKEETYKSLNKKVETLLPKQKKEQNKNILKYLKSLIDKELEIINNEEVDFWELFEDLF